jgi:hypothetical protein
MNSLLNCPVLIARVVESTLSIVLRQILKHSLDEAFSMNLRLLAAASTNATWQLFKGPRAAPLSGPLANFPNRLSDAKGTKKQVQIVLQPPLTICTVDTSVAARSS